MTNSQALIGEPEGTMVYPEIRAWEEVCLREEPPKGAEGKVYDLGERTAKFGEAIISFGRKVPMDAITKPLISQFIRAGTSVGANYCEADDAVSKKEFRLKIGTCRKEAKETKYWLRMLATAAPSVREPARNLWLEAKELHLIFCSILRK